MAKILGEAGRYVSQEAVRRRGKILVHAMVTIGLLSIIPGFLLGTLFRHVNVPAYSSLLISVSLFALSWGLGKKAICKIEKLERDALNMRQGASGEAKVASVIANFPDDFRVVNDISTGAGNLDHAVIGPTGVFIIDTKNWRGVISANGEKELLLNGRATSEKQIAKFVGRIMGVREKVGVLAPGLDLFFQPVFVFTSARVEVGWGDTGNVHCMTDDELFNYIVNSKQGRRLNSHQVDIVAQAFLALAHMDKDFSVKMNANAQINNPSKSLALAAG
jgi:hypothetical protein